MRQIRVLVLPSARACRQGYEPLDAPSKPLETVDFEYCVAESRYGPPRRERGLARMPLGISRQSSLRRVVAARRGTRLRLSRSRVERA